MNFIVNVIFQHVVAAVVKNWFSTVVGIVLSVAVGWPALSDKYLAGHDWNNVDWASLGGAVWILVSHAIMKFALNWKTIAEGVANSAPRAEAVKNDSKGPA